MSTQFYSIEDLTKILKLHPKTILRFIHEGKIKAQKMGRAWRVSQADLKEYTHAELSPSEKTDKPVDFGSMKSRMKVSAVIEINEQNSEEASRLSNSLMAALNCKDPTWANSRVDSFYYPKIQKAKYVLYGTPAFISEIMAMLSRLESIDGREG